MSLLNHSLVQAPDATPTRLCFFLHGLFGSGGNWRTFARRLCAARPDLGAVLIDLRMHGGSQGFAPPHTLAAAAADLEALRRHLEQAGRPVTAVLGHSFGGKVALRWLQMAPPDLAEAWIIDSTPSARPDVRGSEETVAVLAAMRAMPARQPSRAAFIESLTAQGFAVPLSQWLAMNLVPSGEEGLVLRLDLDAIAALLQDYFHQDLWSALTPPGSPRVELVAGGRSAVLSPEDLARARALSVATSGRVGLHVLPQAGHFVHVDDPDGLLALMSAAS